MRILTYIRSTAVAVVSLLLAAQILPSIALACEGASVTVHEGSTSGTAVPVGTTLVGKSESVTIHMASGNVECNKGTFEGKLESNKTSEDKLLLSKAELSGTEGESKMECATTFSGKPTATVSMEVDKNTGLGRWTLVYWWWNFLYNRIDISIHGGGKCEYAAAATHESWKAIALTEAEGPPLVAKMEKQTLKRETGATPCEAEAEYTGAYTIKTSGGKELAVTTP